jgi:hypothetical protein
MRRLIILMIAFGAGLAAYVFFGPPALNAETPVSVLTADRVLLLLPVSPSADRIVHDLRLELRHVAAGSTDPRIAAALDRVADDDDLLQQVAAQPADMFSSGRAAASATPLFEVSLSKERVVVTAITVELVPGYGSTASSRDHEDGHALINERIARRCAHEAFLYGIEHGYRGQQLINAMVALLNDAASPVQSRYHSYVGNAAYGQHTRYAEQALAEIPGCSFTQTASQ